MPAETGQSVPIEVVPVESVPLEVVEKQVQEAATQAVSSKTADMVRKLAEKAATGNATSIRALLELMRGKNQSRAKAVSGSLKSLLGPVLDCTNEAEWREFEKPNSEPAADSH